MEKNKIITYSLLAHINNSGTLVNDLLDIFIPLVKRILSDMNSEGITAGENISEIKTRFDNLFKIGLPLPVLRQILFKIAKEVNGNGVHIFQLYVDDAFIMQNYVFLDYNEIIEQKDKEIIQIEQLFKEFCRINELTETDYSSIFDFIECNKLSLAQYLNPAKKHENNNSDFSNEAKFVEFFTKIPAFYQKIRDIYLGSIISSYLEFKTTKGNTDMEVIFDTNYILSLLDLNSEEAHKTCSTLHEVLKAQGVKLRVMNLTISECQNLLEKKAQFLDKSFLLNKIDPEDICNACHRKGMTKNDLQLISNNLEKELLKLGIVTIPDTTKYQNIAKFSPQYKVLEEIRHSKFAALHDATALTYVREKRGRYFTDFEKVNCWFVNNSSNRNSFYPIKNNSHQPETIKAEDLLNILWLSNPNILNQLNANDLIDIGITRLISCTLNDSLPRASVLKDLEDNIQKYGKADLTDKDVLMVASRIANKSLTNIEELNNLAEKDQKAFVEKLKKEAALEKEKEEARNKKIDEFISKLQKTITETQEKSNQLNLKLEEIHEKEVELSKNTEVAKTVHKEKEAELTIKIDSMVYAEVRRKKQWWRLKSIIESVILLVLIISYPIYIFNQKNSDIHTVAQYFKQMEDSFFFPPLIWLLGVVLDFFCIRSLYDKYRNQTNIRDFEIRTEEKIRRRN